MIKLQDRQRRADFALSNMKYHGCGGIGHYTFPSITNKRAIFVENLQEPWSLHAIAATAILDKWIEHLKSKGDRDPEDIPRARERR